MTLIPRVALDRLLRQSYKVTAPPIIKAPSGKNNRVAWVVTWEDRPGSFKQRRLTTEAEAIRFHEHLASEMERTARERRATRHGQKSKPKQVGGGGVPVLINRREPVPDTDLTITLTTSWRDHRAVYTVAVVDSMNVPTRVPSTHPTPDAARKAANKLYARLTEEN